MSLDPSPDETGGLRIGTLHGPPTKKRTASLVGEAKNIPTQPTLKAFHAYPSQGLFSKALSERRRHGHTTQRSQTTARPSHEKEVKDQCRACSSIFTSSCSIIAFTWCREATGAFGFSGGDQRGDQKKGRPDRSVDGWRDFLAEFSCHI